MTRSQIEYILAVAKHKSFGKAADACFVTQSTLSTMVAKFEKRIGLSLFDRKSKPISITESGAQILKYLRSIHREFQLLDEGINELQGIEFGNVSLACIPTVAPFLYPLILNDISQVHSQVNFKIHEMTTERIIEEIVNGDLDIGIVSTPIGHKSLTEHPLYTEEFLLFDCGEHSSKAFRKVSQIDINRLWLLEEGHCLRNQIGKICELRQQKLINGNLIYNCGSLHTLMEMVKINKGVTLLPKLALTMSSQIDEKNIYQLTHPIPAREIGIIVHKNFVKTRILRYLADHIKKVTAAHLGDSDVSKTVVSPF